MGFKGDLPAFFAFMRKDKQFYQPDTDAGRAAYLKKAEDYLAGMEAKLPEYFGMLPKADLIVKRVEAFREEKGGVQHYYPGHAGWIAAGHLLRPPVGHDGDADCGTSRARPITRACRAITCRSRSRRS